LLIKISYLLALSCILVIVPQVAYGVDIFPTPLDATFGSNDWIKILVEVDGYTGGPVTWNATKPDGSVDSGILDGFVAKKKTHSIIRNAFDHQFGTWKIGYSYKDISKVISVIVEPLILQITTEKDSHQYGDNVVYTIHTSHYEPQAAKAERIYVEILDENDIPAKHMDDLEFKSSQSSFTFDFEVKELLQNNPFGTYKIKAKYYGIITEKSFEIINPDTSTSVFIGIDKTNYKKDEVVELNLVVSQITSTDAVARITDPSGNIITKSFKVQNELTRVFLDNVSTSTIGKYLITVEYAGIESTKTFFVELEDVITESSNLDLTVSLDKLKYRPGETLTAILDTNRLVDDKVVYWLEDPTGSRNIDISVPITFGTTSIPHPLSTNAEQGPWKIYFDYGDSVQYAIFVIEGEPVEQASIGSNTEQQGPKLLLTIDTEKLNIQKPHGIAIDSNNDIYIVDSAQSRIKKLDPSGTIIKAWGMPGSSAGQLSNPTGIFIDSNFVHVADTGNSRIQTFDKDGNFVREWGNSRIDSQSLISPNSISIDSSGIFYVSDSALNKISKYDSEGKYAGHIQSILTAKAKFSSSDFVASDNGNNFFIVVSNDNRILQYRADGNFIDSFGSTGDTDGKFLAPSAMVIDSISNLIIVDSENHRIQIFNQNGNFLDKWGSLGTELGQFNKITGIALDLTNNVYVVDSGNNRIQKFTPLVVELKIPDWIKNNARWWTEGSIGDNDFASGIEYMVKEKIIVIPDISKSGQPSNQKIPDWVKKNAGWWADGQISNQEFASGIEFLVKQGIIRV